MQVISTSDTVRKSAKKGVSGFHLSEDAMLKIGIMKLATNKTGSEITTDAVRLLYAAYALLPKEIVDTALIMLSKPNISANAKDVSEIKNMFDELLTS